MSTTKQSQTDAASSELGDSLKTDAGQNKTHNDLSETRAASTSAVPGGAQHLNWSSVPVERPSEGIERQMVVGQNVMICRFRFAPFLVTPEHTHTHEQMSVVVSGRVRFFVEGEERIASPGDVLHFPPNCRHGATMLEEPVELIDIFTPVREDFLNR